MAPPSAATKLQNELIGSMHYSNLADNEAATQPHGQIVAAPTSKQ